MSQTTAPESDPAALVEPPIRHTVPWRVMRVVALSEARLHLTFVGGTAGEVEMQAFLVRAEVTGTVFEALRDPLRFGTATVVLGAVSWPSGADLAPDAMYDAIREHGRWILD
jgi:hypothetical protein